MSLGYEPDFGEAARIYAKAFEAITPGSLEALGSLCADTVRFKDPFNDVTGREAFARVFQHMFKTVDQPRFTVSHISTVDDTAFLRWRFSFKPKGSQETWVIEGMSEVRFDAHGRVCLHWDHWDAAEQFYERLPVLGSVLRLIKRRLAAS